jgi:hypothetical protein
MSIDYETNHRKLVDHQPIIFKLWKLQISHNCREHGAEYKDVVNVYWNYRWLFSKVPGHITFHTFHGINAIPPFKPLPLEEYEMKAMSDYYWRHKDDPK